MTLFDQYFFTVPFPFSIAHFVCDLFYCDIFEICGLRTGVLLGVPVVHYRNGAVQRVDILESNEQQST